MFKTFFFSELKYSLKQPMVYIFLGLFALMVFGAASSENVQIGGSVGNIYKNAPHIVTTWTIIMSIFGLLVATAFYNNAALRDHNNDFHEILFSTPISKAGYFFGRFFGALFLSTIPLMGIFLGTVLGTILGPAFGWIEAERYGELHLSTFINNYLLFILPNMFFTGTIIFTLANKWKSTVISFIGSIIIMMGYIISGSLLSDLDNETLAALVDVFGLNAYRFYSKYYTPIEKNTLNPGFDGLLLWNRLIWVGAGVIILITTYFTFSFKEKNKRVKKEKSVNKKESIAFTEPILHPSYTTGTSWVQFRSFFYTNFLSISKSVTFKILIIFGLILLISNLVNGFEYFGLQSYPRTYKIIDLIDNVSFLFIIIILVFFSGELIWRDRESKINEVIDATPHTSLISLSAKALSLIAITCILHFALVLTGIIAQLAKGYTILELDVYFLSFLYKNLPYYVIWTGVLISIQVIINHKYIGYFVSILFIFAWELILLIFDVESTMMLIGDSPSLTYSDMNRFGPELLGSFWLNFYWLLFSFFCLLIAGAIWTRGVVGSLKERILAALSLLSKSYKLLIVTSFVVWASVAGFVYYNTQVLNHYRTSDEQEESQANYEKLYKKYEHVDHPKIINIQYFVDIFPHERDVYTKVKVQIINEHSSALDSIHFNVGEDWDTSFEIPNSTLAFEDKDYGYLIYVLDQPLPQGDTMNIEVEAKFISQGFSNKRENSKVVKNGTFLNNFDFLPAFGYQSSVELSDKNTRKKYGLEPKDRMPELQADCDDACKINYLSNGTSDYIPSETIISTVMDQTAIAPGSLIKQWTENDRNYYHYKVDHTSQNFYSFISAEFEVATRQWNGISLEVYYDKKHEINVPIMLDAIERSLGYYIENFGPYYHKQCRIIEFPRYATFAQAFPGSMPYSEAFGFIINLEDENENNVVDAVIAHEMAHQWWAHQVVGANMQGATMMSESFSEYSSLMTMKTISKTPMKMREFLKYDHDRYLRGRSQELVKEMPLYKVENQMYIHYGKGSVILYALQDYIGEEKVNRAMKNFLEAYRYQAPYPTSLDFLSYLEPEVPDSLHYLIDDWFKEITLYDNRLKEATYETLDNGKYRVNLLVESEKLKADSIGVESNVAINDWIDIGFFMDSDEENLYFEKRMKFDQASINFSFDLDSLPAKAAIDPRHLLIDRVYKDNIKTLSEQ
ncbi:M1 family aminopeptidase [Reichenbachiella agarivorans]|uniref:M1 family aminopeptidase n=1 Tax=Reichenbachiella agarivorans TaxID=2979464 RepID=A0ABY6CTY8_9BACT|nr:M1 family aminopeptidase [Reichenbachiella agarivorans]UXP33982.1 M1 family aminopeptidase [Reichenbachiella agarivorans]